MAMVVGFPETTTTSVEAYFAISFPSFTYYVKTLSCTIGRRPNPKSQDDSVPVHVDIDLGPLKNVSRLHARIEYDEEHDGFVICVLGRNGAWVEGDLVRSGSRVLLGSKASIQIASRTFQFLLAPRPSNPGRPGPSNLFPDHVPLLQSPIMKSRSPSVDVVELLVPKSPSPARQSFSPPPPPPPPPIVPKAKPTKKPRMELATLCYQAINSHGGRATMTQVRKWITKEYEWYKLHTTWQKTLKDTLRQERFIGTTHAKAKSTYWSIVPDAIPSFEEDIARASQPKVKAPKKPAGKGPAKTPRAKKQPPPTAYDDVVDVEELDEEASQPGPSSANTSKVQAPIPVSAPPPPPPPLPLPRLPAPLPNIQPSFMPLPLSLPAPIPPLPAVAAAPQPPTHTSDPTQPPLPTPAPISISLPPTNHSADLDRRIKAALDKQQEQRASQPTEAEGVCLPVRIGPIATPSTSTSGPSALKEQPMKLEGGELILNQTIFSHLSPTQVIELAKLETATVFEVLQTEIKRFIKETLGTRKMKGLRGGPGGNRGRGRGRGGGSAPSSRGSAVPSADDGSRATDPATTPGSSTSTSQPGVATTSSIPPPSTAPVPPVAYPPAPWATPYYTPHYYSQSPYAGHPYSYPHPNPYHAYPQHYAYPPPPPPPHYPYPPPPPPGVVTDPNASAHPYPTHASPPAPVPSPYAHPPTRPFDQLGTTDGQPGAKRRKVGT